MRVQLQVLACRITVLARRITAPAVLALLCLATADEAEAGTKVALGRNWPAAQQISADQVDHATFDALLKRYVDAGGDVDYTRWKASRVDVAALDAYLAALSQVDPRRKASRAAQLAHWINAYNAVTLHGILREYPTTSIRNHTAKVFGFNIWKDLLLATPAGQYSLEQIEHSILRKMGEPRIHFAIVCASRSCPRLLAEAYTPQRLDAQLNANAQVFFANSGNFRYDAGGRRVWISPILKWFAEDFGTDTSQQMARIAPYLPDEASRSLAAGGGVRVSYLGYDWGLNDQKTRTANRK